MLKLLVMHLQVSPRSFCMFLLIRYKSLLKDRQCDDFVLDAIINSLLDFLQEICIHLA